MKTKPFPVMDYINKDYSHIFPKDWEYRIIQNFVGTDEDGNSFVIYGTRIQIHIKSKQKFAQIQMDLYTHDKKFEKLLKHSIERLKLKLKKGEENK